MEKAIKQYIDYIKYTRRYSEKTCKSYSIDLEKFYTFLLNNNIDYKNVCENDVLEYINDLKRNNYAISSLNRKIVCLRSFYSFCSTNIDESIKNVMLNISTLKVPKRLPKDLFKQQIKILLTMNEKKHSLAIRNQCIILLLLNTGMRVSECCNLTLMDLDMQEHTIRVFGKGSKERSVFYLPSVDVFLNEYINEIREKMLLDKSEQALFIGSKGTKITPRAIENILNERAKQSSNTFKVTPHMLRHTYATLLLNNDIDLKILQELLGHANLSTTQIYTHVSKARLKKVYDKSHPMAVKLNEIKS